MKVEPADLRASVLWVIEGAAPKGIALSVVVAELRDVEPTIGKQDVAEEIDGLLARGEVFATGMASHGDRRFWVGRGT